MALAMVQGGEAVVAISDGEEDPDKLRELKATPMDQQETMPMHVNTQVLTGAMFEAAAQEEVASADPVVESTTKSGLVRSKTFLGESPPSKVALLKFYLHGFYLVFGIPVGLKSYSI